MSSSLNDEFGTSSGLISSAASIRSASSRPPAIRPDRRLRASATSLSRSSVRSVASRTRAASVRTTAQRAASSPTSVFRAALDRSEIAVSRSVAWLAADRLAEKVVSICRTRRSKATCCSAAIAMAFSVVKSYCGSTAARAAACASVVWTSLSKSMARGATMSRGARSPTATWSGCWGRMSAPRIAASATIRIAAAIARREASRRVKPALAATERVSISVSAGGSVPAAVVGREVGTREGLRRRAR